jgi:hypothetical protein
MNGGGDRALDGSGQRKMSVSVFQKHRASGIIFSFFGATYHSQRE